MASTSNRRRSLTDRPFGHAILYSDSSRVITFREEEAFWLEIWINECFFF